ncbi:hypothetical protein [Blastochloris sulfoviridis]|uniref:Uncharacterized protein n=1 Tax=Blastochloris sulfoviridis TaxID=50712 RepID=A0A5M6HN61_9HYPH|nr:hypothetical protein [Blastochloris sulfoviridis]KAA5597265.1 hypothetical protein F1193_14445 [Blastochloris sulfoviridis]
MAFKKTGLKSGDVVACANDPAPPKDGYVVVKRGAATGRYMSVPGIGRVTLIESDTLSRANRAAAEKIQSAIKRPVEK